MVWWLLGAMASTPLAEQVMLGDCPAVLASAPLQEVGALAEAHCALQLDELDRAEAALARYDDALLADQRSLLQARLALARGDYAEAKRLAAAHPRIGSQAEAAAFLKVMATIGAGETFTIASLDDLPPLQRGEALLALATHAEKAGDTAEAVRILHHTWSTLPRFGWDDAAAERAAALGSPVDQVSEALIAVRLKSLRKVHRHDDALTLERARHPAGALPTGQAAVDLGHAAFRGRDYEGAQRAFAAGLGAPDVAVGGANDLYHYGLSHARKGDYETASTIYTRLIKQHPSAKKSDLASYKLGYMAVDKRDCKAGITLLDAHLKRYPSSNHLDEALWFKARCLWRQGEYTHAGDAYGQLLRDRPKSSLASGAAYWQARALGKAGDADAERAALDKVLARWPESGWSYFAAERLGKRFPAKPAVGIPEWPDALASTTAAKKADALLSIGFAAAARDVLRTIDAADRAQALALAHRRIAAGDYRGGQKLARPYCVSPWKGGDPVAQQACYPRPEAAIVYRVAEEHGLFPLLPFGIMTAESALDPTVTSIAGARGLMQLMPAEGPRIHATLYGDRAFDADDLYSAPYNASMGTAELGLKRNSLGDLLEGTDLPAVIASYNGGEEAVRRWVDSYDHKPDFDEFAEDIGYTETRRYVKRVLGFTLAYRWVYGDPESSAQPKIEGQQR